MILFWYFSNSFKLNDTNEYTHCCIIWYFFSTRDVLKPTIWSRMDFLVNDSWRLTNCLKNLEGIFDLFVGLWTYMIWMLMQGRMKRYEYESMNLFFWNSFKENFHICLTIFWVMCCLFVVLFEGLFMLWHHFRNDRLFSDCASSTIMPFRTTVQKTSTTPH